MNDAAYQYKWFFSNYDSIAEKKDPVTGEKGEDLLKNITECHAHIEADGKTIADEKRREPPKKEAFVKFLERLIDEIVDRTFQGTDEAIKEKLKEDAKAPLKGSEDLRTGKKYSLSTKDRLNKFCKVIIPKLLKDQSLEGSFFEFNRDPKAPGTNDSNNQEDNAEGDAGNLIEKAIENSAKRKKCVVFTGAPGTGKTYCVEQYVKNKMAGFDRKEYFVQFHSSYDYTDFVEGLRPVIQKEAGKDNKMVFVHMDGIFKAFCRKVVKLNKEDSSESGKETSDQKPDYYFVIDEINRADLGRVFGELMYCFEKRGKDHTIATQYANLPAYGKNENGDIVCIEDDCFKDGFYIPDNVIIIGTMNDIDRSVETFDFALRRRFDWVEIDADAVMESSLTSMGVPTDNGIVKKIVNMNAIIASKKYSLGKEFKIGPSYFEGYDGTEKKLKDIWEHNLEPILKEYMRGRLDAVPFVKACGETLGVLPPAKETPKTDSPQGSGDGTNPQPGAPE